MAGRSVPPVRARCDRVGERYVNAADTDVGNLARALFVHNQHFFTFLHEEGVAPTNNVAERALRTAVQWRKIMFGNRSADGELAVARLLTVTRTCQLQHLNALVYLTAATAAETVRPLNCYLAVDRLHPAALQVVIPAVKSVAGMPVPRNIRRARPGRFARVSGGWRRFDSSDGTVMIELVEPHEQAVHEGIRRRGRRA
jgi:hypothetical protein